LETTASYFGLVPEEFSYDDVMCDNTQSNSLDECPHSNTDNCYPFEGAGVFCYNGVPIGTITFDDLCARKSTLTIGYFCLSSRK